MEFRVLTYFLAVAREENISRAAEALCITQPTLSRQLAELEDELGIKLLERGKRKTVLTDAGRLLRQRAEEITALTERTQQEFQQIGNVIAGDIYIGSGETPALQPLAKLAKELQADYPQIHYHLFSGKADDVIERLEKGLLDFGILVEPSNIKQYHSLELPNPDCWGLLMRKDAPLSQKATIQNQDVWDIPLMISQQSLATHELYHWLQKEPENLNIVATYNLLYNASLMVKEGLGYALCLDQLVYTGPDSPFCFRPLEPQLSAHVYLIWKQQHRLSKAAQLFRGQLTTRLKS